MRIRAMEWIAYGLLALLVIVGVCQLALVAWSFVPSLTVDEINGFARLDTVDPGRGPEALAVFYGWKQERWAAVARGAGAAAVAVALALVGATLQDGKTVTETTTGAKAGTKTTTTDSDTSPEAFALLGGLAFVGGLAWLRSRSVQREFAADVGRLTPMP
jgi:hypothetical protein